MRFRQRLAPLACVLIKPLGTYDVFMILTCPSCHARYLIPVAAFAAGPRTVRCARCAHSWRAEATPDPATDIVQQFADFTPPETAKPIPPGSNLPALPPVEPGWVHKWGAISTTIFTILVFSWLVFDRQPLARAYPWLEPVYAYLGLHIYHAGEGLSLRQVRSELDFQDGGMQLIVGGQIHNNTGEKLPIPDILAQAIGADGKSMQSWQIDAPTAKVDPGADVPFQSSIPAPQGSVVEINLTFIEPTHVE